MRPADIQLSQTIEQQLINFHTNIVPLLGIQTNQSRNCLIEQIVDSIRRVKYIRIIKSKYFTHIYSNPQSKFFDPLKAASIYKSQANINEAFWLIFLATHFGKNKRTGWELTRNIYNGLGNGTVWDWLTVSNNLNGFKDWLFDNNEILRTKGSFGNHRKYQSLDAYSNTGTGSTIESYLKWIGPQKDHISFFSKAQNVSFYDPIKTFDYVYNSMNVIGFGRTAKFDYLTMIGKFDLSYIIPGSPYLKGSTGPIRGARLLFGGNVNTNLHQNTLEDQLILLGNHLNLDYGMQVLEDALCNWQKSPNQYVYFRG